MRIADRRCSSWASATCCAATTGVGAVAAQAIAGTRVVPDGVQVLDGGTLGLALLPYLEDAERAILVDAIEIDAPPGTLVRLEGDEVGPAVRRAPQRPPGGRVGPDRGGALARPDPADARAARRRARDHRHWAWTCRPACRPRFRRSVERRSARRPARLGFPLAAEAAFMIPRLTILSSRWRCPGGLLASADRAAACLRARRARLSPAEARARGGPLPQHCALCHGERGDGQGARQLGLRPPAARLHRRRVAAVGHPGARVRAHPGRRARAPRCPPGAASATRQLARPDGVRAVARSSEQASGPAIC